MDTYLYYITQSLKDSDFENHSQSLELQFDTTLNKSEVSLKIESGLHIK